MKLEDCKHKKQSANHHSFQMLFSNKTQLLATSKELAELSCSINSNKDLFQNKPKPFVKWVGGKRQLVKQFRDLEIYPPKEFNCSTNTYFEPFLGGGAVFFDLLPRNAELSDLNFELIATYNAVKSNVEAVITSLKKHEHSKDYFLQIRGKKIEDLSDVEIASRFIYLNRTGFNGLYRVNKKGEFNVPFGRYENPLICDEKNLRQASKSLQNASISHRDYKNVLNRAKKGDFVYFDPPYFPINKTSSFTSYTSQAFLKKEQLELCDIFVKLHKKGCFVMLSNSGTEFTEKTYLELSFARLLKVEAGRAINSKAAKRGKIAEFVITNY